MEESRTWERAHRTEERDCRTEQVALEILVDKELE